MTRIKRLAAKYSYSGQLSFQSLEEIKIEYRKAMKFYQALRPYAQQYRETYLGNVAAKRLQRDGKDIESHFKILMEQEDLRRQFQRIKIAEGRQGRKGVHMMEKVEQGIKVRVTDKGEIKQAIMKANKAKLLQAHNTPLRNEPLQSLLGEQTE